MTVSKNLLLSILAMDSYNRGYNAGVGIDAVGLGTALGIKVTVHYTVVAQPQPHASPLPSTFR